MNKFVKVSKPLVKEITFIGEENYFAMLRLSRAVCLEANYSIFCSTLFTSLYI